MARGFFAAFEKALAKTIANKVVDFLEDKPKQSKTRSQSGKKTTSPKRHRTASTRYQRERYAGAKASAAHNVDIELVETAIRSKRPLYLTYQDAQGRVSQRMIDPLSLQGSYLEAFCHLRKEKRKFKLTRIQTISMHKEG